MKEANKKTKTVNLYTPEGERFVKEIDKIPWQEYPRPHLKRRSYICLNGKWDFAANLGAGDREYNEKITVPFVPQSLLSGICREVSDETVLCYRKIFSGVAVGENERIILNIDAADRHTKVFLNGNALGEHSGGYDRFSFDITEHISKQNTLEITVTDDHISNIYPRGKQSSKRGGMWYTPVSGIWQTVWLEKVPATYITDIHVKTDLSGATVTVETSDGNLTDGEIVFDDSGNEVRIRLVGGKARIEPKNPVLWTPENPKLYRFLVKVGDDEVESYFALRTVTLEKQKEGSVICLNGQPYFFHGLLDQGYFSDGIFLPASPDGYERDILEAKKLGFNMLRKHIKVEPELFYYACDQLGMIVFQDMISCGDYSFLRDTALPTIGFKRKNDKKTHKDSKMRREFIKCMEQTVERLDFHPSVCCWTIFNEGWGQFDHADLYRRVKELDPSRPVDSVSGWFMSRAETVSDIESPHVYFRKVKIKKSDKPTVLSEFGGYSYKIEGHSFNLSNNYGYGSYSSTEKFEDALITLYDEEVIPAIENGLCGAVYTQLSDVEDETNGLMTYDRQVVKVSYESMVKLSESLKRKFYERNN